MKRIFLTLTLAVLVGVSSVADAQRVIRIGGNGTAQTSRGQSLPKESKTWFAGERITGVDASSVFKVVLVRSDRTRAVVEFVPELEPFLEIRRDGEGVVTVGLKPHDRRVDRLMRNGNHPTLTLHLPVLNTVRLSGATNLRAEDSFTATDFDILASGAADIDGDLSVESARAKVQLSGAADIDGVLSLPKTRELTMVISGASEASVSAPAADYIRLGLSGAAELTLNGAARQGQWNVSGGAELHAREMTVTELTLNVSGGSSVEARVVASGADMGLNVSGGAKVALMADGVENAKIDVAGAANVRVEGAARRGYWKASGSSNINAERFALRDLTVTASGASDVRVNVSGALTTKTSGAASVRYAGRPASINNADGSVRPL